MDDRLTALIADVTDARLFAWTDPKMVGRAYGYLDKVEGITFVDGQGIVARVHGTSDYYTKVFAGGDVAERHASSGSSNRKECVCRN